MMTIIIYLVMKWNFIMEEIYLIMQKILIMDEPTSALDLKQKELIHRYISGFTARDGLVIMATHDIMEMQLSNRLYLLNGHSLCETDPQEALRQLQHSQKGVTKDE